MTMIRARASRDPIPDRFTKFRQARQRPRSDRHSNITNSYVEEGPGEH